MGSGERFRKNGNGEPGAGHEQAECGYSPAAGSDSKTI